MFERYPELTALFILYNLQLEIINFLYKYLRKAQRWAQFSQTEMICGLSRLFNAFTGLFQSLEGKLGAIVLNQNSNNGIKRSPAL